MLVGLCIGAMYDMAALIVQEVVQQANAPRESCATVRNVMRLASIQIMRSMMSELGCRELRSGVFCQMPELPPVTLDGVFHQRRHVIACFAYSGQVKSTLHCVIIFHYCSLNYEYSANQCTSPHTQDNRKVRNTPGVLGNRF